MTKFNYVFSSLLLLSSTTVFSQDVATEVVPAVSDVAVDSNTQTTIVEIAPEITAAIGSPEPGKALIVFFRPSAFKGGAINFKVRENDVELGRLRNGNYFTLSVEPGKHEYVVHAENKDVTTIEAEDGETYFISGEVNFGFISGRPNLSPSDINAFSAAFKKLKPSKPLEE